MSRSFFANSPDLSDRGGYYLLLGLIGLILLFLDQRTEIFSGVRTNLNEVSSGIFVVGGKTRERVRSQYLAVQDQLELIGQIEQLELENTRLKALALDRESLLSDNNQLRNQLKLEDRQQTSLLIAEVSAIFYDVSRQSIIINRGAKDGIYLNQAVIADSGLVGQVDEVFGTSSRVLMVTDKAHSLPVLLVGSHSRVIAEGTGTNGLMMVYGISSAKKVDVGELVLTSGLGDVFPYGYPVGRVIDSAIDSVSDLQQVQIDPFVDITTIKYVFLVFPYTPDLPQERSSNAASIRVTRP